MNEFLTTKRAKLISYLMAGMFLAIHIVMYLLFSAFSVRPMALFNLFSMIFYVTMLIFIYSNWLTAFVLATFLEINAHMGFAVYYVGWDSGFQITLIGICSLLFYAEYMGRSMKIITVPSIIIAPLAMVVYIGTFLISRYRPAPYVLPEYVEGFLEISWAVIVFVILLFILFVFVFVALRSQELLKNEVLHDKLTGLPNRYYMSTFFASMDRNSSRKCYWIAILDLDDFKIVNDTYGHNCGDYVLATVANIMKEMGRKYEMCRWGGEEFLIAGSNEGDDPKQLLQNLRKTIAGHIFEYEGTIIRITVTIGMTWFVPDESIDEWIESADKKLYQGKRSGKNCVVV